MSRFPKLFVVAALVGLSTMGCSRYDYVERSGQSIRVDRVTGRTEILRRVAGGGIEWAPLRTADEVAAARKEENAASARAALATAERAVAERERQSRIQREDVTRCAPVQLPSNSVTSTVMERYDGRWVATIQNASILSVTGVEGEIELISKGRTVERVRIIFPQGGVGTVTVSPGATESVDLLTPRVPAGTDSYRWRFGRAFGRPSDCG